VSLFVLTETQLRSTTGRSTKRASTVNDICIRLSNNREDDDGFEYLRN
jgi:hypothetical protein